MSERTSTRTVAADLVPADVGLILPPLPPGGHREPDLVELARRLNVDESAWVALAPYLAFDARQYRRVRVFRDEHWEGLLLCWLPGQATAVHDHGGSIGLSFVLSGALTEERWTPVAEGKPLALLGACQVTRGDAAVELLDTIHRVSNRSAEPAVSLHFYSPPLTTLGAHDLALGTRWAVPVADSDDVQVGGDPGLIS